MSDYGRLERMLTDVLELTRRPLAVAFADVPPAGVPRLEGTHPSGCTFWSLAADGRVFYTVPEDHYNCPIGSYTHNIELPPDRAHELDDTLGLMANIGYIRLAEISAIPRLDKTPAVTVYAPLGLSPSAPDVVIVTGTPGGLMLLHEAATRAGLTPAALLGRPSCMAIPAAMVSGIASSLGCVGNRIYTRLTDGEFYSVIRADQVEPLAQLITTLSTANATLAEYYNHRRETITA